MHDHRFRFLFLTALVVASFACSSHNYGYLSMRSGDSYYERLGNGPVMVAFLRDGKLVGTSGATPDDLSAWPASGQDIVDHPSLENWRRQLAGLEELSASSRSGTPTGATFVRQASGFPFDGPVRDAAAKLIERDPTAAAELLDHVEDIDFGDNVAQNLARHALETSADDRRVASWIRMLLDEDNDAAVETLTAHSEFGPHSFDMLLADLDDVASSMRSRVLVAAARRFATDPRSARGIVDAADDLPSSDEVRALISIIGNGASPELYCRILDDLDERPSSERLELFVDVTDRCYQADRCADSIARSIERIPSGDRFAAARQIVDRADTPSCLVCAILDEIEAVPSTKRADVVVRVLEGPLGHDVEVQRAARRVAERTLSRQDRERVLRTLDTPDDGDQR